MVVFGTILSGTGVLAADADDPQCEFWAGSTHPFCQFSCNPGEKAMISASAVNIRIKVYCGGSAFSCNTTLTRWTCGGEDDTLVKESNVGLCKWKANGPADLGRPIDVLCGTW